MADELRNQTCLKDGLLDSRVGSCDLFGGVDGNLRKVGSGCSGSSIGIMRLGNACYLLYENIDPHSLGAYGKDVCGPRALLAVVIDPAPRPPSPPPAFLSVSMI
jgi:hypothetical protein